MHAYLLVGREIPNSKSQILNLSKKLNAKLLEFPLAKIEDARALRAFTALKVTEPTAIYIDSIEAATQEAQNAFLKNLEEPQPDLYYILTSGNLASVLPTIVSRCEVIKLQVTSYKLQVNTKPTLKSIDKIKNRDEAKELVQNLINQLHFNLINNPKNRTQAAANLKIALETLTNLKANGNVGLQLSHLVINLI